LIYFNGVNERFIDFSPFLLYFISVILPPDFWSGRKFLFKMKREREKIFSSSRWNNPSFAFFGDYRFREGNKYSHVGCFTNLFATWGDAETREILFRG